jgi:radical SAM superfamily enzyme YgiQ (UPF0313 family)
VKKVALLSLFSDYRTSMPPMGPMYLVTALNQRGHEGRIYHRDVTDLDATLDEIEAYGPDLVGMSVFTGYNNAAYVRAARRLKGRGFKIVWGNAHPTLIPEQVLASPFVDFVVLGEGEETLVELVDGLDDPAAHPGILGLGFNDAAGRPVINPARPFIDMDDYLIDWSLIEVEDYIAPYTDHGEPRTLNVTSSRGCPHNCQFCYNLVFNQRRWRGHSAEKFVENIQPVIDRYGVEVIRFNDDNFFVNKKRAFNIVRELGLPYRAEARVEYVDEKFVAELVETKCLEIMFGFESGSDRVLREVVNKGSTTGQIKRAVELLKDTGIFVSGSFIFGYPTETREEYHQTMEFIVELLDLYPNLAFTTGWFLPYPGTGLYDRAVEAGFRPPESLKEWDKFDRWRRDYEMEWIAWDYRTPVRYSRRLVNVLALSYVNNLPLFKRLFRWRVDRLTFRLPLDIWFFSWLRQVVIFSESRNPVHRLLRRMVRAVQGRRGRRSAARPPVPSGPEEA